MELTSKELDSIIDKLRMTDAFFDREYKETVAEAQSGLMKRLDIACKTYPALRSRLVFFEYGEMTGLLKKKTINQVIYTPDSVWLFDKYGYKYCYEYTDLDEVKCRADELIIIDKSGKMQYVSNKHNYVTLSLLNAVCEYIKCGRASIAEAARTSNASVKNASDTAARTTGGASASSVPFSSGAKPLVDEIAVTLKQLPNMLLIDYRGMTVSQDTDLRNIIRKNNCAYKIYKNTVVTAAVRGTVYEEITPWLQGPTGIMFFDDFSVLGPIADFMRKVPAVEYKVCFFENTALSEKQFLELSRRGSRSKLIGRLVTDISLIGKVRAAQLAGMISMYKDKK